MLLYEIVIVFYKLARYFSRYLVDILFISVGSSVRISLTSMGFATTTIDVGFAVRSTDRSVEKPYHA